MQIRNIKEAIPISMKIAKGDIMKCLRGIIWITAGGKDFILRQGDELEWTERPRKAVFLSVKADASISVIKSGLFFKKFSLFDKQSRLAGSLSG